MRVLEGYFARILAGCSLRLGRGCLVAVLSVLLHMAVAAARRHVRRLFRPRRSRSVFA